MRDHGIVFLTGTGQETGHVDEADDGNVEGITETHEASGLAAGVHIEHTGVDLRLVGHDADTLAVETGETDDDVLREVALHFEELTVVDHRTDDLIHVVGHVGVVGDDFVEEVFLTVDGVGAGYARRAFVIVLGQEGEEVANEGGKLFFGLGGEVSHTALLGVYAGTAEIFLAHILTRDGFHHLGAGEEHVRNAFEHDDEVGECGRINGTTGAGTADTGDLGHDARSLNVALEDVGKTGEGIDTFLDARTARVVQTDAGRTHFHGQILHFADFLGHGLGERTTVDGEILSIEIDQAAVDGGTAAHHAVAVELFLLHAEVVAAVELEHVELFETSFVDE